MIEIKDLTVKYGKKTVLDRICLTLSNERFTAILGKNGSGKSTLLSCIT
ncbi:MAG: ATP-binding cassette domain-containing protein, partial [Clostridia bacterium]|nr:ATP-binding cassette domain-containing protein [Clostridia bacterium]